MVSWFPAKRYGPIGVDLGSRSLKLLQLDAQGQRLIEAVRWDLPVEAASEGDLSAEPSERSAEHDACAELLRTAREGRAFRGREAVLCLGAPDLFIQNIRVPKAPPEELRRLVFQEAAGRLPIPVDQAEIRLIEAADVRQGAGVRREVIVLAVHRGLLERRLQTLVAAGLRPIAVDVEPLAMLRCYAKQFRRDEDRVSRSMFVHVGATQTLVVIAQGVEVLFIKYIDVGGRQMDAAVSQALKMELADATALRRHNGDRRSDQQDPEVARSIAAAIRPVTDQLANELSMCIRYQSVTFRGEPLARVVIGGGEASSALVDALGNLLDVKCELGHPLRTLEAAPPAGRIGQWDVATGLALWPLN